MCQLDVRHAAGCSDVSTSSDSKKQQFQTPSEVGSISRLLVTVECDAVGTVRLGSRPSDARQRRVLDGAPQQGTGTKPEGHALESQGLMEVGVVGSVW